MLSLLLVVLLFLVVFVGVYFIYKFNQKEAHKRPMRKGHSDR